MSTRPTSTIQTAFTIQYPQVSTDRPLRILTLCLGNICRSPVAEALLARELAAVGVPAVLDSAGTGAWHIGKPADSRSRAVSAQHGLPLEGVARQLSQQDFRTQDIIFAMDRQNWHDATEKAATEEHPTHQAGQVQAQQQAQIVLMRTFDPEVTDKQFDAHIDVPDPYYGGPDGFEEMYQMLERSARHFAKLAKEAQNQQTTQTIQSTTQEQP